jgi:membrane-bound metal-dependent hydrolase YbcI (DUF457 family)
MYVGHVGAALGAKRIAPAVAMGTLVFATYIPDWVDAALCLSGKYHDAQMYSHSIPAAVVLAALAGATQLRRLDIRAALVVAAVVISHVLLDYITGIKPTWLGGPFIGLEIYRYPILDFAIEAIVIVTGWMFYRRTLPAGLPKWNPSSTMLLVLLLMQGGIDAARLLLPSVNKC